MKLTIKYKHKDTNKVIYPKTKIEYLLTPNEEKELSKTSKELLSLIYGGFPDSFITLGINNGAKQYKGLEDLNLSEDDNHTHLVSDFHDGTTNLLKDLFVNKVPLDRDNSSPKISDKHIPPEIKGQLRYRGSTELSLTTPKEIQQIKSEGVSVFTNLSDKNKKGIFVITSTDGYITFTTNYQPIVKDENIIIEEDSFENIYESINWNIEDLGDEPIHEALSWNEEEYLYTEFEALNWTSEERSKVYLTAGTMIIFLYQVGSVNYFSFIKRDVKGSAVDRFGMVSLSNHSLTENVNRKVLAEGHPSNSNVIDEQTLKRLGFDIRIEGNDLIFENFED